MNLVPIKTFIRKLEARGSFDTIWGGIKKADYPSHNLTKMSVGEVLDWQRHIRAKGYRSTACGGYQFIYKTLSALVAQSKVPLSTKFDAALQDAFAERLMAARGLGKYISGQISAEAFCNELAKEWASLPVVVPVQRVTRSKAGKITKKWTVPVGASYYAGDGLNKAHVTPEAVLAAVKAIRGPTPPARPNIAPTPQISARGGSIIGKAIAALAFFAALAVAAVSKWFCALPFLSFICGD